MAKILEKEKALHLRSKGESIGVIAKKLLVSKSTVSMWCKNIVLSEKQMSLIADRSKHHATLGLLRSAEAQRAKRKERIELAEKEGQKDIATLSRRDIYMIGIGLYWGEGYKKGSQEFGFTNSDPGMIIFYILWLYSSFKIEKDKLILRVSINESHKKRGSDILEFWSQITGIPTTQFTKTSFIKTQSKKIYSNPGTHFGTLRIKVRKGTHLRRRVIGSIEEVKTYTTPNSRKTRSY